MKKNFKKWLSIALAVVMVASALPLIAGAIAPSGESAGSASSSGQAPLKVEIRSNKDKYSLLGKMEFTATITNISSSTVENISAQALLGSSLRPLKNGSQFTATKDSLAPGASFSFKYCADLNGLKGLDNLLLPFFWFSSLFHGGKASIGNGNGRADYIEASKAVGVNSLFGGKYDASTKVKVWYNSAEIPEGVVYRDGVIVDPLKDIAYTITEENGIYIVTLPKNSATSTIQGGTVFVLPPIYNELAYAGIALKATSVSDNGGTFIITCVQPELGEVAKSLNFDYEGEPKVLWEEVLEEYIPPEGVTFEYTPPTRSVGIQMQAIDTDKTSNLGSLKISGKLADGIRGSVTIAIPEVRTKLVAWTWYVPPIIKIDELIFWIKEEATVAFDIELQENPLDIIKIPIGPKIPIVLGPTGLYFELGVEVKVSIDGSLSLEFSVGGKQGMDLKRGRGAIYLNEATGGIASLNLNGNLKAGPEVGASLKWLGLNIMECAIKSGLNVEANMSVINNPLLCTDVGAYPFVEIGVNDGLISDMLSEPSIEWKLPSLGNWHFEQMKKVPKCTAGGNTTYYGEYTATVKDGDVLVGGANPPLAGVNVKAINTANSVIAEHTTDSTGKVNFTLPVGQYTIVFSKVGYRTDSFSETIVRDESLIIDAVWLSKLSEPPLFSTITGKVLEQGTNTPLYGVLVQATKAGSTAIVDSSTTSATGGFMLIVEANATYDFKFTKIGYEEEARVNVSVGSAMALGDVLMVPSEPPFAGGTGTATDPYLISTPAQLNNVRNDLEAHYKLINDIDLAGWGNWEPIGTDVNTPFSGVFDGNGKVIKNMTINIVSSGNIYVDSVRAGFFGNLYTATVKNTGIVNSEVSATSSGIVFTGAIVGFSSNSNLLNCYNRGTVHSISTERNASAGGIAGEISSTCKVEFCYNSGSVNAITYGSNSGTSAPFAGGIVGGRTISDTTISNCYNIGTVTSTAVGSLAYAGGIAGSSKTINSCYNTGTVTGTSIITGGIVGSCASGSTISNCYYLNSSAVYAFGSANLYFDTPTLVNVLSLTEPQMKQQSSFIGFDFDTIWAINPAINNGYPYLQGMQQ